MVPSPQRPSALHQLTPTRSQVSPAPLHHTYPRGPRRRRPRHDGVPAPALFRTHPPASSLAALGRVSVVLVERRQLGVVQCTFGGCGRALDLVGVARASV